MNYNLDKDSELEPLPIQTNHKSIVKTRSDSIQEIISHRPGFLERWSLLIFLAILILLFTSTWFVKYPDIIEANATLSATNSPKEIIINEQGRLIRLFVNNDGKLKEKQVIAWVEATAKHSEVISLLQQLDSAESYLISQPDRISHLFKYSYNQLGELQPMYQKFIVDWQQFDDYLLNGFYSKRKTMLQQDITALDQASVTINSQKDITEQSIRLAEESFKMNDNLYEEKVISKEEYRTEKSKLLTKQAQLPSLNASVISNKTDQREKQKEIFFIDHSIIQQKTLFQQAISTLKSGIESWLQKYTLRSPINGIVVFTIPLQVNMFLQQGKLIGYVLPDSAQYYAEAILPQKNFGKIDIGQSVQLRFNAYPYQEFGFVKGKIDYISKVPSDSGFLATIKLDNGLHSSYNQTLQYKTGLKAQAIIITNNMRLFQRIYNNILKTASINKNFSK